MRHLSLMLCILWSLLGCEATVTRHPMPARVGTPTVPQGAPVAHLQRGQAADPMTQRQNSGPRTPADPQLLNIYNTIKSARDSAESTLENPEALKLLSPVVALNPYNKPPSTWRIDNIDTPYNDNKNFSRRFHLALMMEKHPELHSLHRELHKAIEATEQKPERQDALRTQQLQETRKLKQAEWENASKAAVAQAKQELDRRESAAKSIYGKTLHTLFKEQCQFRPDRFLQETELTTLRHTGNDLQGNPLSVFNKLRIEPSARPVPYIAGCDESISVRAQINRRWFTQAGQALAAGQPLPPYQKSECNTVANAPASSSTQSATSSSASGSGQPSVPQPASVLPCGDTWSQWQPVKGAKATQQWRWRTGGPRASGMEIEMRGFENAVMASFKVGFANEDICGLPRQNSVTTNPPATWKTVFASSVPVKSDGTGIITSEYSWDSWPSRWVTDLEMVEIPRKAPPQARPSHPLSDARLKQAPAAVKWWTAEPFQGDCWTGGNSDLIPLIRNAACLAEIKQAAAQGDVNAQFELGRHYSEDNLNYYRGAKTGTNNTQAVYWFKQAAAQGHTRAQGLVEALSPAGFDARCLETCSRAIRCSVSGAARFPDLCSANSNANFCYERCRN